jgi:phosphoribosylglycinamide formyltransferase-1
MKRIVILISGRGSNMIAIAEACRDQGWPASIAGVVSNRPGCAGLQAAAALGLHAEAVDAAGFADRTAYDAALAARIDALGADLVVLAGYMRILSDGFVQRYAGRMLNIHPSLLPSFPGLHTHRRALQAGVRVHGATVHLVTAELDGGPIVAQAAVPVLAGDDEAALAERVLAAEHRLYPMAVRLWVEGRLELHDGRVRLRGAAPGDASLLLTPDAVGDEACGSAR